ncbi:MAG: DUF4389 domain-containing protein [Anaerolinea sp.]|nr:DUF4389 domain-containing protein [Anaerolinea sp.]
MTQQQAAAEYPVKLHLEPATGERNKLTIGFRWILAIPHAILVGGPAITGAGFYFGGRDWWASWGGGGLLGAVAFICAVICWFAILFANQHPRGLFDLCHFYLRWRVRAVAYMALFRDEYPPFGDGEYAATIEIPFPEGERDKLSVGLRIFYVIPHAIILFFLSIAWFVTGVIAWFALLFNGVYPEGLLKFGIGVMRWSIRVEAYALLMTDVYPPFSLD